MAGAPADERGDVPKRTIEMKCEVCGHVQEAEYWDFVCHPLEKEAVESLFSGSINMFKCPQCDTSRFIDRPLCFYDMDLGIFLQYLPPSYVNDSSSFDVFDLNGDMDGKIVDALLSVNIAKIEGKEPGEASYAPPDSNRVFFNVTDMLDFAIFRKNLCCHFMEKSKAIRNMKVPEHLMGRWNGLYKRKKIRLIYAIWHYVECNRIYSEDELRDLVQSNLQFCDRNTRLSEKYSPEHIARGMIDMGLMERRPDGSAYWKVPARLLDSGLKFPDSIGGMEKMGYRIYSCEGDGYSVNYFNENNDTGTVYIYDKGLLKITDDEISKEFKRAEDEILQCKAELRPLKRSTQVYKIGRDGAKADFYVSDFDFLDADPQTPSRSYVVLTSLKNEFLKIRLSYMPGLDTDQRFGEFLKEIVSSVL